MLALMGASPLSPCGRGLGRGEMLAQRDGHRFNECSVGAPAHPGSAAGVDSAVDLRGAQDAPNRASGAQAVPLALALFRRDCCRGAFLA